VRHFFTPAPAPQEVIMDTQPTAPEAPTPAPAPEKKRSLFETVLTSTPVILTIVATFMVGQSTSEMTRAQYHRAVAGQHQSKVGDQWAFFQAKRIRGTSYEMASDLLGALKEPETFARDTLPQAADRLVRELRAAEKQTVALRDAIDKARGDLGEDAAPLEKSVTQLLTVTRETAAMAAKTPEQIKAVLDPPATAAEKVDPKAKPPVLTPENVTAALAALAGPERAPRSPRPAKDKPAPTRQEDDTTHLKEAVAAIKDRKPEKDIADLAHKISDESLQKAIAQADKAAEGVSRKGKVLEKVLEEFDKLVNNQAALARTFLQAYGAVEPALAEVTEGAGRDAVLRSARDLERRADAIRKLTDRLVASYKVARHAFTARRYEDDARSNQDSAYLYEVNVHMSSARSDHHLERSRNFLYAMLVAQVGVTIASVAMAVKQQRVVWLLATLAGLAAIAFGVYVYVGMR
jgi:hypothetical protein